MHDIACNLRYNELMLYFAYLYSIKHFTVVVYVTLTVSIGLQGRC